MIDVLRPEVMKLSLCHALNWWHWLSWIVRQCTFNFVSVSAYKRLLKILFYDDISDVTTTRCLCIFGHHSTTQAGDAMVLIKSFGHFYRLYHGNWSGFGLILRCANVVVSCLTCLTVCQSKSSVHWQWNLFWNARWCTFCRIDKDLCHTLLCKIEHFVTYTTGNVLL